MSDQEELELEALRRRLDDAFETTRPRRGFEDELWLSIQVRRPFWTRLQDAVAGFVQAFRESPAVPMAATAAVLVVVIGVGIVSLGRLGGGTGGGTSTAVSNDHTGSGAAAGPAGAPLAANAHAQGSFGNLPRPQGSSPEPVASPGSFGPVSITWTGHLSLPITSAPVFRYYEPTNYEADQFANSLGASSVQGRAGFLGTYAGSDLNVQVRGSFQSPAQEPYFYVTPSATKATSVTAATDAAYAFLSSHSLVPSWPYTITAATTGNFTKLHYLRQFTVPSFGNASLVDSNGVPYGMEVDVQSGQVVTVMGPLPLNMDSAIYPIISADQAVSLALSTACQSCSRPPGESGVQLDQADLVYVLVVVGNQGFYEPAILFSSTSSTNGVHVLVPAVDQSQLTP
jgi:hypothetical protein